MLVIKDASVDSRDSLVLWWNIEYRHGGVTLNALVRMVRTPVIIRLQTPRHVSDVTRCELLQVLELCKRVVHLR